MTVSKRDCGFIILDEEKLPQELISEIKHFNGLMKTFNQSPNQKAAITLSEDKINRMLQKHKGLYPLHVVYGYIPLFESLNKAKTNSIDIVKMLKDIKESFGEEYFNKLLLFDPILTLSQSPLGLSSFESNSPEMNVFMLAVKNGNIPLVQSILGLIEDIEFKKKMLQQSLQYWNDEHHLLFKPILDLAIDSNSAELVDFLMSNMNELDILPDIALDYRGLVSTRGNNTNILKRAIEHENLDIIHVILNYRSKLGRVFYLPTDDSYPNYIITGMNLVPVFLTSILNSSPDTFEKILDETINDFNLNQNDDYWSVSYKITTMLSSLSMIDLTRYIQHEDYNPLIYSKILSTKVTLDRMLDYLSIRKIRYELETGIPMLRTPEGNDFSTSLNKNLLWIGDISKVQIDEKSDHLTLPNLLNRLFDTAMTAYNYQAAALTLYEYFKTGHSKELNDVLSKQKPMIRNLVCNFLMFQAIKNQDSSLIGFLSQYKFELKKDIFKELSEIKDPQSLVFVAKELFHNLHENKIPCDPQHIQIILDKILHITKNNKTDENLSETIHLFLREMRHYPNKPTSNRFFGKSKQEEKIEKLLDEIDRHNSLYETKKSNG